MSEESAELRRGLVRHRLSRESFADRCGMSVLELDAMLESGELSDAVRGAYAVLEVEGDDVLEGLPSGNQMCWAGKAVRNPNLLVICFDDGSTGMVRKKVWFKPKMGVPLEVELSDEEGFWKLVGDYRPNGVRLDG